MTAARSQDTHCVAVFTARSPQRILKEGGSQAWALDPARVRVLPYLVCVQNQNNPNRDFSDASEPHGSPFLVGRISDVIPSEEDYSPTRWKICISEFSVYQSVTNAWQGWRNPVKYSTLEEMGVDFDKLDFHSMAEFQNFAAASSSASLQPEALDEAGHPAISIADAKRGLAAFYRVPPDAIEIIIRG